MVATQSHSSERRIRRAGVFPIIGRAEELAQVQTALVPVDAVVTLWGPPGIGKTALAKEVLVAWFKDGLFCDLRSALTIEDVLRTMAEALGLERNVVADIVQLRTRIVQAATANQTSLVVLDNVEGLVASCRSDLRDLFQESGLRYLLTSREALGIEIERVIPVGPLPAESDAMTMLVDRVERFRRQHVLPQERPVLVALASRLGGVPLAIELVSEQVATLGASAVFDLLDVGQSMSMSRSVAWSYERLSPSEQEALKDLAVFSDGFLLEDVRALLGREHILHIDTFVRRSLLHHRVASDSDDLVFDFFVPIAEYVHARLAESNDFAESRLAHAHYCLEVAEEQRTRLHGEGRREAYMRLRRLRGDLVEIERRYCKGPHVELGGTACAALGELALLEGPLEPQLARTLALEASTEFAEISPRTRLGLYLQAARLSRDVGRLETFGTVCNKLESLASNMNPAARAAVWLETAYHRSQSGDLDGSRELTRKAREAAEDQHEVICESLILEGTLASEQGNYSHGALCLEQAREHAEEHHIVVLAAQTNRMLAYAELCANATEKAEALFYDLVECKGPLQSATDTGFAMVGQGLVEMLRDNFQGAREFFERAVEYASKTGHFRIWTYALSNRALSHMAEADYVTAIATCEEALKVGEAFRGRFIHHFVTACLAAAEAHRGDLAGADRAAARVDKSGGYGPLLELLLAHVALAKIRQARASRSTEPGREELLVQDVAVAIQRSAAHPRRFYPATPDGRLLMRLLEPVLDELGLLHLLPIENNVIAVAADGSRFKLWTGIEGNLSNHAALARIFAGLCVAHVDGKTCELPELVQFGWPGEKLSEKSARSRVYVAVSTLRKMGLSDVLVSDRGVYGLSPKLMVKYMG